VGLKKVATNLVYVHGMDESEQKDEGHLNNKIAKLKVENSVNASLKLSP